MHSSTISLLLLSATLALAHDAAPRVQHARRMELLVKRQNITTPTTAAAVVTTAASPVAAATTSSDLLAPLLGTTSSAVAVNSAVTSSIASSSAIVSSVSSILLSSSISSSISSVASSSAAKSSASSVATSASSSAASSVSSKSSSASSSSASSSASAAADSSSSSSGISHGTLIAIIVVASCVAGIAAIWTIVRKTKFSPSRRFEAKLEPIGFVPGRRDTFDGSIHDGYGPGGEPIHGRSGSSMSGANAGSFSTGPSYPASNLARTDSNGGSLRGGGAPMSEVSHIPGSIPYNQSSYTGQPYYPNGQQQAFGQGGYPAEQYGAQYADLQRGPSSAAGSTARSYTPGAYNYQAHNQASGRY